MSDPRPPLAIGIDVGGTKIAGGVVDATGRVTALTRVDTPRHDVTRTRAAVLTLAGELVAAHPVVALGIAAAGWVAADRATIRFAPHVSWRDEPLRDHLRAAVPLPVVVENDANAAAWAELRYGAGRGSGGSLVLVTVGTGIGTGILVGGALLRGGHGFAGEVGHQQAVPDGLPCPCGRVGCLEVYASGRALVRYAQAGATARPGAAARLRALAGGNAEAITGPWVTRAARAGDEIARDAFLQVGRWLASGLVDLVQVLDPDLLVVGGGVAEAGDLLLDPTREAFHRGLGVRGRLPVADVVAAQLGNLAGLVGAADLAREAAAPPPPGPAGRAGDGTASDGSAGGAAGQTAAAGPAGAHGRADRLAGVADAT